MKLFLQLLHVLRAMGRHGTLLVGEEKHLAVTLEFWGCGGCSHLVVGSCATLGQPFSLRALFFQLCNEAGSFYLFFFCVFICLFYLCYIFVSGNALLIENAVPTALQQ